MENTISVGKAAKILSATVKTLERWEREACLMPISSCNFCHDRDINTALNLKGQSHQTDLPVNLLATKDTVLGQSSNRVGKVTLLRYESGFKDRSGQEKHSAHFYSHFL